MAGSLLQNCTLCIHGKGQSDKRRLPASSKQLQESLRFMSLPLLFRKNTYDSFPLTVLGLLACTCIGWGKGSEAIGRGSTSLHPFSQLAASDYRTPVRRANQAGFHPSLPLYVGPRPKPQAYGFWDMRFMFDITDTESHFLKQFYLGAGPRHESQTGDSQAAT